MSLTGLSALDGGDCTSLVHSDIPGIKYRTDLNKHLLKKNKQTKQIRGVEYGELKKNELSWGLRNGCLLTYLIGSVPLFESPEVCCKMSILPSKQRNVP